MFWAGSYKDRLDRVCFFLVSQQVVPMNDLHGQIFLSLLGSPLTETDPTDSYELIESLNWRFLSFDISSGNWNVLPGNGSPYFWVSPDASKITFVLNGTIWLRDTLARKHRLFDLPEPTRLVYQGAWASDGSQFIVSFAPLGWNSLYGTIQTWLLETDSQFKTRLPIPATDGVRDWSHNGEWLLTSSKRHSRDKRQMYIIRLDGTERRWLPTEGECTQCRFSPDGLQIASCRGPRQGSPVSPASTELGAVWLMNLDCSDDHMVFGHSEISCQDVRWSIDGEHMAIKYFRRAPSGSGELDLSKPFFAIIDRQGIISEEIHPPEPFRLFRTSTLDWR